MAVYRNVFDGDSGDDDSTFHYDWECPTDDDNDFVMSFLTKSDFECYGRSKDLAWTEVENKINLAIIMCRGRPLSTVYLETRSHGSGATIVVVLYNVTLVALV